ncbi:MAG: long-chain fatty acid--CoA ligase [Clostridiales Family XIII bacterium]|jgi:long-chain acyl-CoA synthetase|nr:long-chain fatty acid--CoA ligase [Clostridiales Family XIII bacterium]
MESRISSVGQIYKNNYTADKPAVLFKDEIYTYADIDDKAIAYANYLRGKGVKKGDKVILNTGNSPEFFFVYLGTVRNAAVIVPINPMLTLQEIKFIASDSDAKFIVIHEGLMQKAGLTEASLGEALGLTVIPLGVAMIEEVEKAPREDFDLVEDPNEISTFLYTSGTTGHPKAAMLSHGNLIANAWQCNVALETEVDDVIMCVLPMFHVFAFTTCILLPLFKGATTDIIEAFQPKVVISELLTKQLTIFMGVPAMYMVLIEAGKNDIKFPKLRKAVCGGSALPVEIYRQVKEILGLPIIEGYGLTEASPATMFNPPSGVQKAGSIGQKLPEIEFRIGGENDEDLPVGAVGELLLRGPNIMQGYYNNPEETAETLRNGWLHTGDLAQKDEEDYIYIVDRKKDMVIVSGLNVYPREVEEALYKHPQIKDVAVIGVSDKLRGEIVVAYIVLKEGEEQPHHKEILRWLKEYLAVYKIPRRIEIVDDLPRNSTGKIMKRILKEQVEAELAGE